MPAGLRNESAALLLWVRQNGQDIEWAEQELPGPGTTPLQFLPPLTATSEEAWVEANTVRQRQNFDTAHGTHHRGNRYSHLCTKKCGVDDDAS